MSPETFTQQYSDTPHLYLQLSSEQLVRRNSLSLRERTPPPGSLADEILTTPYCTEASGEFSHYAKARTILSNLKEMTERYSDFASCESEMSLSDDQDSDNSFRTQDRRKKSGKHRLSTTPPDRDFFLKKSKY